MAISPSARTSFVTQVQSQDGSKQSLGIGTDGQVHSWGPKHSLGQLGRTVSEIHPRNIPGRVDFDSQNASTIQAVRVYAGGFADAGHSAILDRRGQLWMAGCDRWQQLGFGSPSGGAGGYSWLKGGRIYHSQFLRNDFVLPLLQRYDSSAAIRDVALGGDHSVVLSSNKRDVVAFGKGGEGQLGLSQKLFLSAPAKSSELSGHRPDIAAVCAIENCSLTLDDEGSVLTKAGKCRETEHFLKALGACQQRASDAGLLQTRMKNSASDNYNQ